MEMEIEEIIKRIKENDLQGFLISFYNIFENPNDSIEYEKFEDSYHELLIWINQSFFHRISLDEFEEKIQIILENQLLIN